MNNNAAAAAAAAVLLSQFFFTESTWFFVQPSRFFYWTNLVRTDSIALQNRLSFFTELTRFFELVFFSLLTKVHAHSRL